MFFDRNIAVRLERPRLEVSTLYSQIRFNRKDISIPKIWESKVICSTKRYITSFYAIFSESLLPLQSLQGDRSCRGALNTL